MRGRGLSGLVTSGSSLIRRRGLNGLVTSGWLALVSEFAVFGECAKYLDGNLLGQAGFI